jgi:hypothetical protein
MKKTLITLCLGLLLASCSNASSSSASSFSLDISASSSEALLSSLEPSASTSEQSQTSSLLSSDLEDSSSSDDISLSSESSDEETYTVTYSESEFYRIEGLKEKYGEGEQVTFKIILLDGNHKIYGVTDQDMELTQADDGTYGFKMPKRDVILAVHISSITSSYKVNYDIGSRSTPKPLSDPKDILKALTLASGDDLLYGVADPVSVYGGGSGGSAASYDSEGSLVQEDSKWSKGDMLKIGNTSSYGGVTFKLNRLVTQIAFKGFTTDDTMKITISDASPAIVDNSESSSAEPPSTGKLTINGKGANDMPLATKESVEKADELSYYVIDLPFQSSSLRLDCAVKKAFYITEVRFGDKA